jgi:four helix bundle protein
MKTGSYRELVAWQRAMTLAQMAFSIAQQLRAAKLGSVAGQLERAAASIAANIAEGHGRYRPAQFAHSIVISLGSLREAETFVELGRRLGGVKNESAVTFMQLADEVGKVLYGLKRSIDARREISDSRT